MSSQERVTYFNGQIVPESEARVSFRDAGFTYGHGVFDTARTFGGRIFKLQEHVDRLFVSLKYAGIAIDLSPQDVMRLTQEVTERNLHLLEPGEDYWVSQRITQGMNGVPTVIIECTPLPLKARASLYRDGIEVVFPSTRRTPPESLSPNVKSINYLNMIVATMEVHSHSPDAWAILLDTRGFLAEGMGSNLFLVHDGVVYTPKGQYVLEGVSRQTVIELAGELGIPVVEQDLTPYDAYRADEAFITSTSLCLCPVQSFNKNPVQNQSIPGPVTQKLIKAFSDLVDFDFVGQYLAHLS